MPNYSPSPIPVFVYHRVLPYKSSLSVTIEEFEHHMQRLKAGGFSTLSGVELQAALRGELKTERAVVITFDDGYFDNWYLAAPILEKYGMRAMLFVITGKIDERKKRAIGGWREEEDERYLSWEEIDWMIDSGIFEIHSHTHSHIRPWRTERCGAETKQAILQDIASSIKTLRDRGHAHELHLAWPWGYFRQDWLDDVLAMGINCFHGTHPGINYPGCDLTAIRRLNGSQLSSSFPVYFSMTSPRIVGKALNTIWDVWAMLRGPRP